jgi:hypothetical protein
MRYADRNHSGIEATQTAVRTTVGSAPSSRAVSAPAASTSSSTAVGRNSRAARSWSQPTASTPRRRWESRDAALAYPPTMKNTGMTCTNQVIGYAQVSESSAECPVGRWCAS